MSFSLTLAPEEIRVELFSAELSSVELSLVEFSSAEKLWVESIENTETELKYRSGVFPIFLYLSLVWMCNYFELFRSSNKQAFTRPMPADGERGAHQRVVQVGPG